MLKVALSAAQTFNTGTLTPIVAGFGAEYFDEDNNWNTATGTFTAPTNGLYGFDIMVTSSTATTLNDVWKLVAQAKTGSTVTQQPGVVQSVAVANQRVVFSAGVKVKLSAGDTVQIMIARASGTGSLTLEVDADLTWMSAQKIE